MHNEMHNGMHSEMLNDVAPETSVQLSHAANPRITMKAIIEKVATHYTRMVLSEGGVITAHDITHGRRTDVLSEARHLAMYFSRVLTHQSYPQIGAAFGGKNHTTVENGCIQTKQRIASDVLFKVAAEHIQGELEAEYSLPPHHGTIAEGVMADKLHARTKIFLGNGKVTSKSAGIAASR